MWKSHGRCRGVGHGPGLYGEEPPRGKAPQIADNGFAADLAGTVGDKPVEGILNGGFLGADAKTIVGFIEGTIGGEDVLGILGAEQ